MYTERTFVCKPKLLVLISFNTSAILAQILLVLVAVRYVQGTATKTQTVKIHYDVRNGRDSTRTSLGVFGKTQLASMVVIFVSILNCVLFLSTGVVVVVVVVGKRLVDISLAIRTRWRLLVVLSINTLSPFC